MSKRVRANPTFERTFGVTPALVAAGDLSAAECEAVEIRSIDSGFSMRGWLQTYPLSSPQYRARLLELLAKVGLQ